MLLEKSDIDVNLQDINGYSCLMTSSKHPNINVTLENEMNETALMMANDIIKKILSEYLEV